MVHGGVTTHFGSSLGFVLLFDVLDVLVHSLPSVATHLFFCQILLLL